MLANIITICVYIICISTGIFFIVEIYRFVKRKLVKEPEVETPQATANLFDLPDSCKPPKQGR